MYTRILFWRTKTKPKNTENYTRVYESNCLFRTVFETGNSGLNESGHRVGLTAVHSMAFLSSTMIPRKVLETE